MPADRNDLYYTSDDGQQHGPVAGVDLRRLAASGELAPNHMVSRGNGEKRSRAGKIRGLFPPHRVVLFRDVDRDQQRVRRTVTVSDRLIAIDGDGTREVVVIAHIDRLHLATKINQVTLLLNSGERNIIPFATSAAAVEFFDSLCAILAGK
jgi:GYF domain 2